MPQLLLELFCEEIPARMQAKAESDLGEAIKKELSGAGLEFGAVETLGGPRRLTVIVNDLAEKSADVREERKGPKVGAPEKAVEGFMRGAGLTSIDQAEIKSDPKKGDFYVAVIETPGRVATDIIAEIVPSVIRGFHWPKSMRWGTGDLRWVRPLQRVVCVFGGNAVPFEVDGLASGNETEGHRVHGRGPFAVTDADSYKAALEGEGHVMLSREARRSKIHADAQKVCADAGLELVEDIGLLEEVTGLAEWPVVLLGEMDPAFLDLPEEVIQLSMRVHQKYFAVRDPKTGGLAPNFVVVANISAKDGGKKIAEGNSRVLSARLNDGRFFWDNDLATPLEEMGEKLKTIDFKKELGTIADKVERVSALARELAPKVGADPALAERAARLSKSDLVSEMVYEFPELQGVMGRYYAQKQGEPQAVADAIRDHYKPQGPSDAVPSELVSIAVALADKLDTLVGFWAIDEKPTGSKDPFALRRAALGVVRIVLENNVRLALTKDTQVNADLLSFFADRLKQYLRDQGKRHDLIDAVFALGEDDLVAITNRVDALQSFLSSDDGANLLAGFKRAANILKAEEKKDGTTYQGSVNQQLLSEKQEKDLFAALQDGETKAGAALTAEDFEAAMGVLSSLRGPIDAFFDHVTVNAEDVAVRQNRLYLLSQIRSVLGQVADFTKIEG
ncbi:glycine--tRNA ligase subunit beta [Ponticaulis sp.]|uniref:glycine--tRNA ligase subunit beta n=1 Tax=Ponticaulis sp. TaxID=2020902 RepID=UPI000B64F429|nr:glycine--tRNA ligase subunit beta [Ponticaulis sp.]MAJ08810.1 glycine--tRNA ligase subunit beta [Ponticaulis sp.]RPG17505.1 MAG: glycine--tRNA ligase subunit beta [Hyphomonadaceae bacterium TMED125]HBH90135.1 glycine--tRNA ligase subunit beta [Hyphomonadaceae bacterium]HBJ93961.1 glycine--tRNA ligase subunit beta [Hyphomonadaceae bacterium]|tara:strand:- start:435 stop:2462 length:2028 start_codon:yes stop_codon:yes gene_type:complete